MNQNHFHTERPIFFVTLAYYSCHVCKVLFVVFASDEEHGSIKAGTQFSSLLFSSEPLISGQAYERCRHLCSHTLLQSPTVFNFLTTNQIIVFKFTFFTFNIHPWFCLFPVLSILLQFLMFLSDYFILF